MTLIEILQRLNYEPKVKREYLLKEWGVPKVLWKHIQASFNEDDRLITSDGTIISTV
jgi:hypothetical protein